VERGKEKREDEVDGKVLVAPLQTWLDVHINVILAVVTNTV